MKIGRIIIIVVWVLAAIVFGYWFLTTRDKPTEVSTLTGSGTVEATEVTIAPEVSGRITEVFFNQGDQVNSGESLFTLDNTLLAAQLKQGQVNLDAAMVGMDVARNSLVAAQDGVDIAQAQYDLTLAQALQQAQPARSSAWRQANPSEFDQPAWYYTHEEQLTAATDELNSTRASLDEAQASLDSLLSAGGFEELPAIETRLAQARVAFSDADAILKRSRQQNDQSLIDSAQDAYDAARDELEAAQSAYDELLSTEQATDILNARSRLAVSQERYDTAQDRYNGLLTGEDSFQVQLAAATLAQAKNNVNLAESRVSQAQAAIDQAQAAVDLIHLQMEKLAISAPMAGVVLARNIEPGEVIQAGASAITLGELEHLTITVFIPENRYGEVQLGDTAQVKVDSFPNQTFDATVTYIADQAEFTPRNVQTAEGRSTTVYAVKLAVQDPQGLLKPGMPADVTFGEP